MGQLQIPRQYLPPKYILDIPFYVKTLKELDFMHVYKEELLVSYAGILCIWGLTGLLRLELKK